MLKHKNPIGNILIIILLYIYFHDPFYIPNIGGLLGRGVSQLSMIILYICGIWFLFFKNTTFKKFTRIFPTEITFLTALLCWSIIGLLTGEQSIMFTNHLKIILTNYIIPLFFLYIFYANGIDTELKFVRILLIVACVGAAGTLLCMMYPSINEAYKLTVLKLDSDNFLLEGFRGFGFSTALTSGYGYIQGALVALGIYYGKENRWYYLFIPFVFMSAMFNARTGAIIAVQGIILYLVRQRINIGSLVLFATFAIVILNIQSVLEFFIDKIGLDQKASTWIQTFFTDIEDTRQGGLESSSTGNILFGSMLVWPENTISWILGNGNDIFKAGFHSRGNSDIGYIRQLNYGGLIYISILYSYVYYMIKRLFQQKHSYFAWFFLISALILNLKSSFMWYQGGVFGFYLLIYYYLIYSDTYIKSTYKRINIHHKKTQ